VFKKILIHSLIFTVYSLLTTYSVFAATPSEFLVSPNPTANISRAMTIEADVVNYLEDNQFVDATGNVIFVYKNYTGTANHSTLDTLQDQLTMDHGFVLQRYSRTFKGDSLDYNLRTETGLGQNVEFNLSGNNIHGKEVFIGRDKILVNDATMTICDEVPPHYYISASKITIYPKWNMTVADNAVLHILGVPVAYIPSYVANNQARDVSQLLIPEFGENRVEGQFVKLKLGYHASEKVQGTIDMDYLEKLEYRLGFTNTSLLDAKSSVQTRVHQVGRHGMELGFRYQTLLGVPSEKEDLSVTDFFAGIVPPTREEYPELLVDLTFQEIVNYEFISYLPQFTLLAPSYKLGTSGFYLTGFGSASRIFEENTGQFDKFRIFPTLGTNFEVEPIGIFHENINYDTSHYTQEDFTYVNQWYRFYNNFGLTRKFWMIDAYFNFRHTFGQSGASPFRFDAFNQAEARELSFDLGLPIGENRIGYHVDYVLDKDYYRNVDYYLSLVLHDFVLRFDWRTTQGGFKLGINLK